MTTDKAIQHMFIFKGRNLNLPWHPRHGRREHLTRLFGQLEFNKGAEIGTCRGAFALALCIANPQLHLMCVDPWSADHWNTQRKRDACYELTTQTLNGRNVELVRKSSMDAVKDVADASLDFVYIDGDHRFDFIMQDLIHWVPKVRKEGIIALHDYHSECGADVMTAINAYTHCHDIRPWYVTREQYPTAFWVQR